MVLEQDVTAERDTDTIPEAVTGVKENVEEQQPSITPEADSQAQNESLREEYEQRLELMEKELSELRQTLEDTRNSEAFAEDLRVNGQSGNIVTTALSLEEKIRVLTEKLEELKRRILELFERIADTAKGKASDNISALHQQSTVILTDLNSIGGEIEFARMSMAEKLQNAIVVRDKPELSDQTKEILKAVKQSDLITFHQKISAETQGLHVLFAAALARDDRVGNAMTSRVIEELEKREIDQLSEVARSSPKHIMAAKNRAYASLKPVEVLKQLLEQKKVVAAEKVLKDPRLPGFLRSENGGEALYLSIALKAKHSNIPQTIAKHLGVDGFNKALRKSLDNLDAKAAGTIIRLGANPDAFIQIIAAEDNANPFLDKAQRRFMNDMVKFWNQEQSQNNEQSQEAESAVERD